MNNMIYVGRTPKEWVLANRLWRYEHNLAHARFMRGHCIKHEQVTFWESVLYLLEKV